MKVIVVVPMGNKEPEVQSSICVMVGEESQLSVAVGVLYVTAAVHAPAGRIKEIFSGHTVKTGSSISSMRTVKEQVAELPAASVARNITVLMPIGKKVTPEIPPPI